MQKTAGKKHNRTAAQVPIATTPAGCKGSIPENPRILLIRLVV